MFFAGSSDPVKPGANLSPAMIMRATQKKMMSGAVTSVSVG